MPARPDRRMQQLIMRDQKTVLQEKEFAKKCHLTLQDFERLNHSIVEINTCIGGLTDDSHGIAATIAELEKHSTAIDVELIRAKRSVRRLQKYGRDVEDKPMVSQQQLMTKMTKNLKLKLLQKCTGICVDQSDASRPDRIEGLLNWDNALRPFCIENTGHEDVVHQLWSKATDSCTHIDQLQHLFDEAEIVGGS